MYSANDRAQNCAVTEKEETRKLYMCRATRRRAFSEGG